MSKKAAPAAGPGSAWPRMMTLLTERRDIVFDAVRDLGLTPPHVALLVSLISGPQRMGDLAAVLVCDASYITTLVDRLEELGLAERRAGTADRRVKEIVLTARGQQATKKIQATVASVPAQFARLDDAELRQLDRLMAKLIVDEEINSDPFRPPRR
jgi:DNA-binding MarR family transcriptional regulator